MVGRPRGIWRARAAPARRLPVDGRASSRLVIGAPKGPSEMSAVNACIANIGPRERRKRMLFGVLLLALGAVVGAALLYGHVHRLWRVALFLPFWMGSLGVFQATGQT